MLNSGDLSFSFSGLKTAVLTAARAQELSEADRADLAAEFQEAVTEVLAAKAVAACRQHRLSSLVVAGGVGANRRLRERLDQAMAKIGGGGGVPGPGGGAGKRGAGVLPGTGVMHRQRRDDRLRRQPAPVAG